IAGWFILDLLPGGFAEFVRINGEAGKFQVIDFDPSPVKVRTIWAGLIGGAVGAMGRHRAGQDMGRRYLWARAPRAARTALVLSGFLVTVQFFVFLMIGLGLYALVTSGVMSVGAGTRNDEVFGIFIVNYLPAGLIGLVTAAVLASAMASFSSSLNSAA